MLKNFPKATLKAVIAGIVIVAVVAATAKKFGVYRSYIYACDPDTGKPTGKPVNVQVCQFGKPSDFTAKATS